MNADELSRALGELGADVRVEEPQAAADARRRRVVSQMQRVNVELVRENQKVRWLRLGVGGGLVAGAAAAVALFVLGPLGKPPESTEGGATAAAPLMPFVPLRTEMTRGSVTRVTGTGKERLGLGDSLVLEEAQALETQENSHARVHGGRGLDIDVGPGSRVVVGALEPKTGAARLELQRGLVSCSVDPAGVGPKLSVITPDATVSVKGTIFSVEVMDDGESTRSCVRVQRGLVEVARGGRVEKVSAGQSSGCAQAEVPAEDSAASPEGQPEARPARPSEAPLSSRTQSKGSNDGGLPSLARQNSLLARALAAEREGRLMQAESQLTELLEQFPSTPLRVDAETARTRIRKRMTETTP